ncbi:8-amino-7-oxononanoate synthase [Methylogaea oryzae]|uniref:8-amino-7-oxononanoate synthase n=1 Tax=Methylogaea oryzae TaxID=1295382 RepID=A0A8D4VQW6_9GAMM|nr:8-amino-7-oxononanoate synthase [Methylogaea oryzae]BBL72408.1 8-amino-7-oxononanoate synthase [Methylogaea oryzae]
MRSELAAGLAERAAQGLYRRRRVLESPQGPVVRRDGREFLNFCGNDYLGLANHPEVVRAFALGAERWGAGGGASHLVCGHTAAHHALEEELAVFAGRERALLFSSGYMANLGVIAALTGRGDSVLEDKLNHASLIDGGLLSGARFSRYGHADVASLQEKLAGCGSRRKLVASDGVFSMDGDVAPLPQLAAAARSYGAWLMVDDAHGLGVLGANGGGSLEHLGLGQEDAPILMGTLGKAFGVCGAFVAGCEELIETLIQQARTYIYTTSLPPAVAEATRASLRLAQSEGWRREKLRALVRRFRAGAEALGLELMSSDTPIQPVLVGANEAAVAASERLAEAGVWVAAIRPPTVPAGTARLRVTLSAAHDEAQVDRLLDALAEALRP